ncbi:hypothetical protein RHMOL_Rhmol04G0210500 [Rhododendron molle]|uniref:Uncharacterized protein n=1 Tax=Rhododendron molle TaxID=49168 RepID=A0ACC0P308_RHOML|nr:hypothetical protein RHMOL_Rhmol04G0210500 [Rhododendron molle]
MLAIGWNLEDKTEEWKELVRDWNERYFMGFPPALVVDQAWLNHWEREWKAAQADPLDGLSLFMLFHQPEPVIPEEEAEEYVWDPQPNTAQLASNQNFNME